MLTCYIKGKTKNGHKIRKNGTVQNKRKQLIHVLMSPQKKKKSSYVKKKHTHKKPQKQKP